MRIMCELKIDVWVRCRVPGSKIKAGCLSGGSRGRGPPRCCWRQGKCIVARVLIGGERRSQKWKRRRGTLWETSFNSSSVTFERDSLFFGGGRGEKHGAITTTSAWTVWRRPFFCISAAALCKFGNRKNGRRKRGVWQIHPPWKMGGGFFLGRAGIFGCWSNRGKKKKNVREREKH